MQKTMKELPLNETKFSGNFVALPLMQKLVCELSIKEQKHCAVPQKTAVLKYKNCFRKLSRAGRGEKSE